MGRAQRRRASARPRRARAPTTFLRGVAATRRRASTTSATASSRTTGAEVKEFFEELKARLRAGPDLHAPAPTTCTRTTALVCELTWNTFRDHLILEYEIPKYDGDLGRAERLRAARARRSCRRKVDLPDGALRHAALEALVHARTCSSALHAAARHGVQRADRRTPRRSTAGKRSSREPGVHRRRAA